MGLKEEEQVLTKRLEEIKKLRILLTYQDYSKIPTIEKGLIYDLFYPEDEAKYLQAIQETGKSKLPKTTPEQDAWILLIQLQVHIKNFEDAITSETKAKLFYKRACVLHDKFIEARDAELNSLYHSIDEKFIQYYSYMHRPDEPNFSAELKPKEAGLDLEVDFYGRGKQPPHALHSEGHQDSMGICLWLALSEKLTQGVIDLLILDDVVMSVDIDHRRQICDLLKKRNFKTGNSS